MMPGYSEILELIKKGSTLEAQEKILELREIALRFQEENLELRKKMAELEEKLVMKESVIWKKPSYWVKSSNTTEGPYCQKCYDSMQKLIRLQDSGNDCWNCHECKSYYQGPNYIEPRFERDSNEFY